MKESSGFASKSLATTEVKHKTFVEVNEEGTEAAAATSVGVYTTSVMQPRKPFRMIVDRPFFCAIRDNQTGTLLFGLNHRSDVRRSLVGLFR